MTKNKNKLAISAAKLYYQSDFSQAEIAKELDISRPSVSRLLQYAKDKGFVRIEIFDPIEDQSHLAKKLMHAYKLKHVAIANAPIENEEDIKLYIGRKGAEYLSTIIKDGDIIGVGWGTTMHHLSHSLTPHELKGAQIVQLEGGITLSASETYATEVLERFAANYKTVAQSLPLPVLFDSREVRDMVYRDRHIQRVLELGKNANIALFSVGTVRNTALFFRLGYADDNEKKFIKEHAVGDICSRFFYKRRYHCRSGPQCPHGRAGLGILAAQRIQYFTSRRASQIRRYLCGLTRRLRQCPHYRSLYGATLIGMGDKIKKKCRYP